jgi:hypothetical protein
VREYRIVDDARDGSYMVNHFVAKALQAGEYTKVPGTPPIS